MQTSLACEQNMCECTHSMAAHLMTEDALCGFCFCRRHMHLRQSPSAMSRSTVRLLQLQQPRWKPAINLPA